MSVETRPCPSPPPRQKIPKDGWGPRGAPDCYYTSRALNSTTRYVKFVKELRAKEEKIRLGNIEKAYEQYNTNIFNFFSRSEQKRRKNKATKCLELCMESYENELEEKRKRLLALYEADTERDVKLFIAQTQAGAAAAYQDKMKRLAHLIDKRKKEHEARYSIIPLDNCSHVRPHLFKLREIEAAKMNLRQIEHNQKRKMAEAEIDNIIMWHEAARIEVDTIEQYNRDTDSLRQLTDQLELRRQQREKDRERLIKEVREMKAQMEEIERVENEQQQKIKEENAAAIQKLQETLAEHKLAAAQKVANEKFVTEAWVSVIPTSGENLQIERKRQMQRDMVTCNKKMSEMRNQYAKWKLSNDPMILEEGRRRQDAAALKINQALEETRKQRMINQNKILQQIKEKEADVGETFKTKDRVTYHRQVAAQLDHLVKCNRMTAAQANKLYYKDLNDQVEFNNTLKERAKQEELDQIKKYQIANDEYQKTIDEMVRRPYHSDHVHLFRKILDKHDSVRLLNCLPVTTKY